MADVVVMLKIMPESPESHLETIQSKATKIIEEFGGQVGRVDIEPVAFGLQSVNFAFVMDEAKGSTDELEKQINDVEQVQSVEITDVRRAVG